MFYHLGFRNLKKYLKRCPHTFHLIWLGLRLWCYLRYLWAILLWLWCYLLLSWVRKVCGHLFMYFSRFSPPNGLTERYVLQCPPRFIPKRDFHPLIIIKTPDSYLIGFYLTQRLCFKWHKSLTDYKQ